MDFKILKIYWQGPYSIEECVQKFSDYKTDYGIYQIYGNHNVNGVDNLLYIGKSDQRPFQIRFLEHKNDWIDKESSNVEIYIGRFYDTVLPNNKLPTNKQWSKYIDACEKMLIYHCQPSYNVREKYLPPAFADEEYILLNIGKRHRLPAEISTYFLKNFGILNPDNIWIYESEDKKLGLGFIEGIDYIKMLESKNTEFDNEHNQKIYSSMLRLAKDNEPVDLLTVGNDLKKLGIFDQIGGFEYLVWLSQLT